MGERLAAWHVPAEPGSVPELRRRLRDTIAGRGFDEAVVSLAVTEAITNAVRHAYPGSQGPVAVTVETAAGRLVVTVVDEGVGARSFTMRGDDPGLGLGLPLLHELCAGVRVDPGNSGTTITMSFAKAGQ